MSWERQLQCPECNHIQVTVYSDDLCRRCGQTDEVLRRVVVKAVSSAVWWNPGTWGKIRWVLKDDK